MRTVLIITYFNDNDILLNYEMHDAKAELNVHNKDAYLRPQQRQRVAERMVFMSRW